MLFRRRWMIILFVFSTLGLISIFQQSVSSGTGVLRLRAGRRINDAESFEKPPITEADVYKKTSVKLFAGTKFFNMPVTNERFLGHCSVKNHCRIIEDIKDADAVLYHGPDYVGIMDLRPDQIAVLWFLESPISFPLAHDYHERVNWTMTYRRESDVPLPYGVIRKSDTPIAVDYEKIWNTKTSTAIWLISNCAYRNGRLRLGQEMEKNGLHIEMFGTCGGQRTPNNCDGVQKQSDECVAELFRPYKFAISFENSLCKDYITEKFFEVLQKRYAVPIVMQRARYEDVGAPEHSFIAVDDFKTVKELVDYVHKVENDKEEYLAYHKWRESYTVESEYFSIEDTGFCEVCKKIMRQNYSPKNYASPRDWHMVDTCEEPQDGFVLRYTS